MTTSSIATPTQLRFPPDEEAISNWKMFCEAISRIVVDRCAELFPYYNERDPSADEELLCRIEDLGEAWGVDGNPKALALLTAAHRLVREIEDQKSWKTRVAYPVHGFRTKVYRELFALTSSSPW